MFLFIWSLPNQTFHYFYQFVFLLTYFCTRLFNSVACWCSYTLSPHEGSLSQSRTHWKWGPVCWRGLEGWSFHPVNLYHSLVGLTCSLLCISHSHVNLSGNSTSCTGKKRRFVVTVNTPGLQSHFNSSWTHVGDNKIKKILIKQYIHTTCSSCLYLCNPFMKYWLGLKGTCRVLDWSVMCLFLWMVVGCYCLSCLSQCRESSPFYTLTLDPVNQSFNQSINKVCTHNHKSCHGNQHLQNKIESTVIIVLYL